MKNRNIRRIGGIIPPAEGGPKNNAAMQWQPLVEGSVFRTSADGCFIGIRQVFIAYFGGALSDEEMDRIDAHCDGCPHCRSGMEAHLDATTDEVMSGTERGGTEDTAGDDESDDSASEDDFGGRNQHAFRDGHARSQRRPRRSELRSAATPASDDGMIGRSRHP